MSSFQGIENSTGEGVQYRTTKAAQCAVDDRIHQGK